MTKKFELKSILAAVDLDGKEVWDELSDEEKKSISFFTLNRFISNVDGTREVQEHYLLVCNERFNKNLFSVMSKHPKLTWQLACSCNYSESKKIRYHEYIKIKKEKNKKLSFLSELFPNMKMSDLETLDQITDEKEIKKYCESLGWDRAQINAIRF
jgi:hypothetical protein